MEELRSSALFLTKAAFPSSRRSFLTCCVSTSSSHCRSVMSELSDLPDALKLSNFGGDAGTNDFNEGLKTVWAAVHPDVTMSPESNGEETIRTHLYPFKGGSPLTRRISPAKKRISLSSQGDHHEKRQ